MNGLLSVVSDADVSAPVLGIVDTRMVESLWLVQELALKLISIVLFFNLRLHSEE
jgi:hypothetical protein